MSATRCGAIIGFGNVAAHGHVPGWRAQSDLSIVAVSDPDPQRRALARELIPGVRVYTDTGALFRHEQLDFVDIATPPGLHAAAIRHAAQAGAHVLCEKPLTTSLVEYRDVRDATHRAGVVLHTVHNWKYSEAFRAAQQVVADGSLGTLNAIAFDTARNGCAAASGDNWRVHAALAGGGILVDHGWHAFYLLLALANARPQRISARVERRRYVDAEVEDTALCSVQFPGLNAEIRLTWAANERRTTWRLSGDDGELRIDDDRLVVQGKESRYACQLTTALSSGSHHPEWFSGVIQDFRRELDDPAVRGRNQAEAELCLLMLSVAYASAARDSEQLEVPLPEPPFEERRAQL